MGHFDGVRITATHVNLQTIMTAAQKSGKEPTVRLYNVVDDPRETTNLAAEPFAAPIIAQMEQRLAIIKAGRAAAVQHVWMRYDRASFQATHVKGDCSANPQLASKDCLFTHSWIANVS